MSAFIDGFSDELEKFSGAISSAAKWAIKSPFWRVLAPAMVIGAGVSGARAVGNKEKRAIIASSKGPSQAALINYHKALGLPERRSKLQAENESINFARYREKQ